MFCVQETSASYLIGVFIPHKKREKSVLCTTIQTSMTMYTREGGEGNRAYQFPPVTAEKKLISRSEKLRVMTRGELLRANIFCVQQFLAQFRMSSKIILIIRYVHSRGKREKVDVAGHPVSESHRHHRTSLWSGAAFRSWCPHRRRRLPPLETSSS